MEQNQISSCLIGAMMTKWIVFDYDGTLTTHRSGWTLLHSIFGTSYVQSERREAYQSNNLTFREWADLDIQNWIERGATRTDINQAADAVKMSNGAKNVLHKFEAAEYRFGVLSGGLKELTVKIRQFDPEFIRANPLVFDKKGNLTGVEKEVGPSEKGQILRELGAEYGFDIEDVTFVGDSHSDFEAMQIAGQAILFDPIPSLDEDEYDIADVVIEQHNLSELLEYI